MMPEVVSSTVLIHARFGDQVGKYPSWRTVPGTMSDFVSVSLSNDVSLLFFTPEDIELLLDQLWQAKHELACHTDERRKP